MSARNGMLTLEELSALIQASTIDTVLLAFTDMQGRLQGKRCAARYFLDEVVPHAAEACNYLLAVDVEMNTVAGYAMSSWERGYGDMVLRPDWSTLRMVPWHEATALVLCDVEWTDGSPVVASPRQVLRGQLDRLAERGLVADVGTELEFMLFRDSFDTAWRQDYRGLEPANLYNVDYSMLGTARVEPVLRRIRNGMAGAGMIVESAKGECNLGQHEIAFRYADALTTCDNHAIYKTGAKEIADQAGMALTFMAKYDEREGNSCHIHISLRSADERRRVRRRRRARVLPAVRALRGRPARLPARAVLPVRAEHQLLQALRRGLVRADRGRLGPGQPDLRAAGGRARARRCGWRTGCPAGT